MFALYIHNAGTDANNRFEVVRMLMAEYSMPLFDAKLLLAGARVRLMTAMVSEMQAIRERLEELGATAVIEILSDENDASS